MDAKVSHQFHYNANMKSISQVKDLLASKFILLPDLKALDHKLSATAWSHRPRDRYSCILLCAQVLILICVLYISLRDRLGPCAPCTEMKT